MPNITFSDFTLEASPSLTDYLVGYRTAISGGERRTTIQSLSDLLGTGYFGSLTANRVLLGQGNGTLAASDLSYSTPTLSVPDAFNVSSAGSIALTAGGSNEAVSISSSGSGAINLLLPGGTGVTAAVMSDTAGVWQRGFLVKSTAVSAGVHAVNYRNSSGGAAYLTNAMAEGTEAAPTTLGTSAVTGGYLGYAYAAGDFREITRIASITSTTFSDTDWSGSLRFYTHIANATGGATLSLELSGAASCSLTGGGGNMTITAGTGASRTLTLRTTTSGSTATTALVLDATQGATFTGAIIATPQALSGAGAVNLTTTCTDYTSTGNAQALTLANGTSGQIKTISHVVDGGSGVLTPTTKIGFTSVTFTNVGDSVTLRYTANGWAIIGIFGATVI